MSTLVEMDHTPPGYMDLTAGHSDLPCPYIGNNYLGLFSYNRQHYFTNLFLYLGPYGIHFCDQFCLQVLLKIHFSNVTLSLKIS